MKRYCLIFPILLVFITIVVCFRNYIPGTYLSGWDTLHPEFNFGEYVGRTLSVWQEHQGLGAPPSQAHAAELPRLLLYFLSSLVLPQSFLRYSYFFLTLILGPLGVYFFIREFISYKLGNWFREGIAFLGGILYLFNLTTVQLYFVPLEMFATLFASLGWIFLLSTKFLVKPNKKLLLAFSLVMLFSLPLAHTPTLFYALFLCFSFYLLSLSKLLKKSFKAATLLIGVILLINLYWLLPNLYYVSQYGQAVTQSKINTQFSDRALETGINFGDINNTSILRNFLFNWGEYDVKKGFFVYLLNDWQNHLNQPLVLMIGLLVFGVVILGLVITLYKKQPVATAFLPIFIIAFFFINSDNGIFITLTNLLQDKLPVVKESLRFPYTKFSNLLLFSYVVYFCLAISWLIQNLRKYHLKRFLGLIIGILALSLIYYGWPSFQGNLISSSMRVNFPDEYFQTFDFFKFKDKSDRIAEFPVNSFWGWQYYTWGYQGAGFLWFGLRQPLLDREFDRWNPTNENYYWEVSQAVYSQDLNRLEKVLQKYRVKWLLMDWNVLDASSAKAPYLEQFTNLVSYSPKISLVKSFGQIKVYQFKLSDQNNFISTKTNLPSVGPKFKKGNLDQAFLDQGDYISDDHSPDSYYPFRSLFSNTTSGNIEYHVQETPNSFIFTQTIPTDLKNYQLKVSEDAITWYDNRNLDEAGVFLPKLNYQGSQLSVTVPKVKNYFSAELSPLNIPAVHKSKNCDYLSFDPNGQYKKVSNELINQSILQLTAVLADNCSAQFLLPNLSHQFSYLIRVDSQTLSNKGLLFWLENLNAKRIDQEVYLPKQPHFHSDYFIQPPMEEFGQGYFLHFDNISYNKSATVNDLGKIEVYPIPYSFLTTLKLVKSTNQVYHQNCPIQVNHPANFWYSVKDQNCPDHTLILAQSFDKGWIAFSAKGIFNHVMIDNWANGWEVSPNSSDRIIIFFWPQLLEWGGLLVLIGYFFWLILSRRVLSSILSK